GGQIVNSDSANGPFKLGGQLTGSVTLSCDATVFVSLIVFGNLTLDNSRLVVARPNPLYASNAHIIDGTGTIELDDPSLTSEVQFRMISPGTATIGAGVHILNSIGNARFFGGSSGQKTVANYGTITAASAGHTFSDDYSVFDRINVFNYGT